MVKLKEYTREELYRANWTRTKSFWPVQCAHTGEWMGFNVPYYKYNYTSKKASYAFACEKVAEAQARDSRQQADKAAQNKLNADALEKYSATKYFKIESRYDKISRKIFFDLFYKPRDIKGRYINKIEFSSLQEAEDTVNAIKQTQDFKEKYYGKTI